MAFKPSFQPGDRLLGYSPGGDNLFFVRSVTATVATPAGTFENCLELVENPGDPRETDIILYARGIGRVSEKSSGCRITLVSNRWR